MELKIKEMSNWINLEMFMIYYFSIVISHSICRAHRKHYPRMKHNYSIIIGPALLTFRYESLYDDKKI